MSVDVYEETREAVFTDLQNCQLVWEPSLLLGWHGAF